MSMLSRILRGFSAVFISFMGGGIEDWCPQNLQGHCCYSAAGNGVVDADPVEPLAYHI